jgi:ABC-2 type transport system ATP-binding protein
MLGDPGVLILDEPANGLDPEGIRWMRDLLQRLAGEGRTVLVSSHLLAEMELLADDIVIIAKGALVAQGEVSQIIDSIAHAGAVRVRTPQPDKLTAALDGAVVKPVDGGALIVTGADAPAVGAAALRAGVELHELVTERPDLERVFLELTSGKAEIR